MGNSQSSSTNQKDISTPPLEESNISVSERGLKSETNAAGNVVLSSDESSITEYVSDSDEELMEEEMEEMMERERILADALKLKELAGWYLHPEEPVQVDCTASARCYFSQPFASEQETVEESEEAAYVLRDAMMLKKLATDYLHPEVKVVTEDSTACGRCYFARPSAEEQLSHEEAEEVARIMEDAKQLKKLAVDFNHPEEPVATSACARNFFSRPSAPLYESEDEAEEREKILAEAKALKKLAVDYMHPERLVEVDATATARNYFSRPSAPLYESEDEAEERERILAEANALKKLAVDYMHPERPVEVDAAVSARSYFSRYSAPKQTTEEYEEAREEVLADVMELKRLAADYLHPERPVQVDSTASARNYFMRDSAPEQTTEEEEKERQQILADCMQLKKYAGDYLHPERPVQVDSTAFGRNYFSRPSAPLYESEDEAEERERILAEAKALKKLAVDYMHPERPVEVVATASARSYFSRPSAPLYESEDEAEEREMILAEAMALKKLAVDYMHPERPVEVDATASARNFFSRPSAEEQTTMEVEEALEDILADAKALKKLAVDYLHPEHPVEVDATATARNYFSRPSAELYESEDEAEEREKILAEAKALKKLAVDYLHPERPVEVDAIASGRNFFSRPSAELYESQDEAEERERILAEAQALKKLAVDYMHPEVKVATSDPSCYGRNYFNRPSCPEQTTKEEDDEGARILADAQQLKRLAVDYHHPENKVVTTDPAACGRNYFSRPSAPGVLGNQTYKEISPGRDGPRQAYKQEPYGFFDMDEEVFSEIRENLVLPVRISGKPSKEDEGDLSRSPSSVMLFGLGGEEAY